MKASCALLLVVSLAVVRAGAEGPDVLRPMDAATAAACDLGRTSSAAFRDLVATFDPGAVVVHVVSGDTRVFGTTGMTSLSGAVGRWRYVRITLDPDLPLDQRTAVLAHELQHAREIITAEASSQHDVRNLYERIGVPVTGMRNAYETADAVSAGARVWRELRTPAGRAAAHEVAGGAVQRFRER